MVYIHVVLVVTIIITNIKGDNYVIGENLNQEHEVCELDANTLY